MITVAALAVRSRQDQNNLSQTRRADSNEWPVTDYSPPDAAASDNDAVRKLRSSRYDNKNPNAKSDVLTKLASIDSPLILDLPLSHGPTEPALPVEQSDVIVSGRINDAKAYLSNDRTNIYSEFSVIVEEVFKGNPSILVTQGVTITTERRGGAVRFQSAKVLRLGSLGKNAPQVEKRYVLFLTYSKEAQVFPIITGYELRGGKVFPLDGLSEEKGSIPQFKNYEIYEGTYEISFLDNLRSIINHSSPGSKEGGRK